MGYLLVVDDSLVDRQLAGRLLEKRTKHYVEYASNGLEALEVLESRIPLAIVTDLQMPEMDGMQLVEAVRRHFSTVPVIVITAHGSEEIALQALMHGAADYVPKSKLAAELPESVEGVLAIATGDRPHRRLSHCLRYQELQYELDNDVLLIPPLVEQLQHVARDLAVVDDTDSVRLAKALVEALTNAVYHGNLELTTEQIEAAAEPSSAAAEAIAQRRQQPPYCERHIHLHAEVSHREARFTIRDHGPGFDVADLPDVHADPSHLSRTSNRGLVLIRMFMDQVAFNPAGNEITMVKLAGPR
jgi:CheY-like chemotaxis protein